MSNKNLELEEIATVMQLLSDRTRLMIVIILNKRACCVCEFVEALDMSQPSISQHLRKLKDRGIVKENKKEQWVYYSMNCESGCYPLIADVIAHSPNQDVLIDKLIKNSPVRQKFTHKN